MTSFQKGASVTVINDGLFHGYRGKIEEINYTERTGWQGPILVRFGQECAHLFPPGQKCVESFFRNELKLNRKPVIFPLPSSLIEGISVRELREEFLPNQ
jgi:hypothetical protein